MSDTTTGIQENDVNGSAIIDTTESATVVDGMAMEMMDNGNVKIWNAGKYCGLARIIKGTDVGVSSAVKGDRIALLRKGIHEGIDSEDDVLTLNQPVKCVGTVGALRLWVGGTDYVDDLVGYVDRLKDANKKILVRLTGGA